MPQITATTSSVDDGAAVHSNTPIKCAITTPSDGSLQILAAEFSINGGANTAATIAADGQSFTFPIATVGTYKVTARVSNFATQYVCIGESGGAPLLFIYPNPGNSGFFTLGVT
jgi:hypothetical protein